MTYTAVNPHACCNRPRPEDAHAAARSPPHPHASPHLTNSYGLRWKTDGRPPANGPPTDRRSKDATAHPHQPGAHPDPPHPDRAHSRRHHPAKPKVKFPLQNRKRVLQMRCEEQQHRNERASGVDAAVDGRVLGGRWLRVLCIGQQ
jgi:hypothetical protein